MKRGNAKKAAFYLLTIGGLALLALGLYCVKAGAADAVLPYVCVGAGCGAFGHGMGGLLYRRALKNAPEQRRRLEVEREDERNVRIAERAKGKAYDAMVYIFGALLVSLALMDIPLFALLLLVFAYLLVVGVGIYYRLRYEKEM